MEIKPVNSKGNQPRIFIGRTDAEAEALILWPPDAKSRLIGKDTKARKDWGQKQRGPAEDGMVGLVGHDLVTEHTDTNNLRKVRCTLTTIFEKKCGGY